MPGTRGAPVELKVCCGVNVEICSSLAARERSMNVTASSWEPAFTCTGMFANRFMIASRAGAPPRSRSARSSGPPMSPRHASWRSTSTTSVCRVSSARG